MKDSPEHFKIPYFCGLIGAMPDSIKVVRQILILFVEVRILVGQQEPLALHKRGVLCLKF